VDSYGYGSENQFFHLLCPCVSGIVICNFLQISLQMLLAFDILKAELSVLEIEILLYMAEMKEECTATMK